jgi:katanin p80 WD40 repeat-containing subunit B1
LNDFKLHDGQIQCLDFHPNEFLLATGMCHLLFPFSFFREHILLKSELQFYFLFFFKTGSADKTVKFWDLETFEMIGSSGPEVTI